MKNYITTKSIRRVVAVITLSILALLVLQISYVGAKYIEKPAASGANNGLNAAAGTDVDNLFLHVMNESLPVGSIYMTTDITSVADMVAQFGGAWVAWGQGRVPVGINVDGDPDGLPVGGLAIGGSLTGGSVNSTVPLNMNVTGTLNLTDGGVEWDGPAVPTTTGVTAPTGGTLSLAGSGKITSLGNMLPEACLPKHRHEAQMWATWNHPDKTNGCGGNGIFKIPDPGTAGTTATDWSATWGYTPTTQTAFTVDVNVNLATDFSAPTYSTSPTAKITAYPTINYTKQVVEWQQTAGDGKTKLAANGSGTLVFTDDTLQPYITCYMYKRTALATLALLPA